MPEKRGALVNFSQFISFQLLTICQLLPEPNRCEAAQHFEMRRIERDATHRTRSSFSPDENDEILYWHRNCLCKSCAKGINYVLLNSVYYKSQTHFWLWHKSCPCASLFTSCENVHTWNLASFASFQICIITYEISCTIHVCIKQDVWYKLAWNKVFHVSWNEICMA